MMIKDNRKLIIEKPTPGDVSRDIYVPKIATRRNWSNNNNNSDSNSNSDRTEGRSCVPIKYADVIINQNTDVIRARSHIQLLPFSALINSVCSSALLLIHNFILYS